MNGPPTPPLTTPTEIEDAARSSVPPQAAAAPPEPLTPTPQPDRPLPRAAPAVPDNRPVYESLFPTIADLAAKSEFQELIQVAERGDLLVDMNREPTRLLLIAPLVLAYLIIDDLSPARHALTRLPENLQMHPLSQMLFNLMASAWERNYDTVYIRIDVIVSQCQQSDFLGTNFVQVIEGMTNTFAGAFRKRTAALIAKAYTSIPVSLVQKYLGLSTEQTLLVADVTGWLYDASTQVLTPKAAGTSRLNGAPSASSTLLTFDAVAGGLARLET